MCGILGGNNPIWDYQKGIECMKHRGPDGIRISSPDDFTLAFASELKGILNMCNTVSFEIDKHMNSKVFDRSIFQHILYPRWQKKK